MKKTMINENVYYFTDNSILKDYSNSTVVFTESGPVIIDTFGSSKQFDIVRAFIAEKGYKEPYAVILTHGHFDHSLGLQVENPSYPIYAHENSIEMINNYKDLILPKIIAGGYVPPETKPIYPTVTFEEEMIIRIGSYCFRLIHTPIHTSDSITVYEEKCKLAFTGDNFNIVDTKVVIPNFNFNSGINELDNIFIHSLNRIKDLMPKLIVQGHGSDFEPEAYFDVLEKYKNTILNFARIAAKDGRAMKTVIPKDVFDSQLIEKIYDINGEYSSFKDNLMSAYKYLLSTEV